MVGTPSLLVCTVEAKKHVCRLKTELKLCATAWVAVHRMLLV